MPDLESRYVIPGLQRGLRVLEYLAGSERGATLSEIARELQLPRNSVYRIAITLRESGFALQDDSSGCLRLSPKILGIGFGAVNEPRLLEEAYCEMVAIRDASKETTVLCVLSENEAVIVEQVAGVHAFRFVVQPGHRTPLHASAQGKALLGYLPAWQQTELLKRIRLTPLTSRTIVSLASLRRELDRVRERGYAVDLGETCEGVHCVSAPIFDHRSMVVAAITVTGPSDRLRAEDCEPLGQLLRRHTDCVSNRLGNVSTTQTSPQQQDETNVIRSS